MISRRAFVAGAFVAPAYALTDSVAPSLLDNGSGPLVRRGVHYTGPVYLEGTREGVLFEDCAFDWYVKVNEAGNSRMRDIEFRRCGFRSQPSHTWGQPLSGLQVLGDTADVRVMDCYTLGPARDWYALLFYGLRGTPTDILVSGGEFTGLRAGVYAASCGAITVERARFHDIASTENRQIPVGAVALSHVRDAVIRSNSIRACAHGIAAYIYPEGHAWIEGNDMQGVDLCYSLWGGGSQWLVERESIPDRWAFADGRWSTA